LWGLIFFFFGRVVPKERESQQILFRLEDGDSKNLSEKVGLEVAFWSYTQELLGSNFGRDSGYLDSGF
jgi:hypothetical protein